MAISSSVYSCLSVSRGKSRTPMTITESPKLRDTRGGVSGIDTSIPNRDFIASMVSLWLGLQQDSTPCETRSLTSSTESTRRVMVQFPLNIESASANPKYVFILYLLCPCAFARGRLLSGFTYHTRSSLKPEQWLGCSLSLQKLDFRVFGLDCAHVLIILEGHALQALLGVVEQSVGIGLIPALGIDDADDVARVHDNGTVVPADDVARGHDNETVVPVADVDPHQHALATVVGLGEHVERLLLVGPAVDGDFDRVSLIDPPVFHLRRVLAEKPYLLVSPAAALLAEGHDESEITVLMNGDTLAHATTRECVALHQKPPSCPWGLDLSGTPGHPRGREVPASFRWPPASPAPFFVRSAQDVNYFDILCTPHNGASKAVFATILSSFERTILTNQELNPIPDYLLIL